MILAFEDMLGEQVLRRLLAVVRPDLSVESALGYRGKGYLKTRARQLNDTARVVPVFLLVDADTRAECPAGLIHSWLHGAPHDNMLFRVAVMEVESWILADRQNCAAFLSVPLNRIPLDTDGIDRPKEFLVNLARRSRRRDVREDLVPADGATASIGPAYNSRVSAFVSERWDPTGASAASESLRRCAGRLRTAFVD